ncbi:cytochrome P450 [Echria macrotheca]|uniref:Cytochrome P450 n=1 Tax=Echria macrotheca TaxID=438768 RepID=A0AAJ0BIS4_9PEZI|nr:cytochrome P450 [Echria macrotheca]
MAHLAIDGSAGGVVLLLTAGLIIWYATTALLSWWRLRHVPGPFLASFSYLWLARVQRSGRMGPIYRDLPAKYGSLVRIGPNEVTTDDPEVIRRMSSARTRYVRDSWYLAGRWTPYEKHFFNELDSQAHDAQKARVLTAYTGKTVDGFEGTVDEQVAALVDLVRRKYLTKPGSEIRKADFAVVISYFTMDVITKIGTGEAFGYLRTDSDVFDFLAEVRSMWWIIGLTLDIPWVRALAYSNTFLRFFGPRKTDKSGLGKLMGLAGEIVDKRFESGREDDKDALGTFIRAGLTRGECAHECIFMITAGTDQVATVIRISLLNIITNPRVYGRLKQEIFKAIREGRVSSPITLAEAKALPYLQAVIYEGLRQRAPTPGLFLKDTPPEGDYIDGKFIPGGVGVGINASALVASKALFGEDADIYRPERFLDADPDKRDQMERDVELIFGYGRWMCIGKNVAWLELNKVLFELFRHFDFQIVDAKKPWESKCWQVWVEDQFYLNITETRTDY